MKYLKHAIFFLRKNNALKILQFNTLQKKIVFYDISLLNDPITFYIDTKTVERAKNRLFFKGRSRG